MTEQAAGAARRVRLDHLLGVYAVGSREWSWQEEYASLIDRPVTQQLLAKVREEGILEPILLGNDGRVWDGHHRITVAMELGLDTVPVEFIGGSPGLRAVDAFIGSDGQGYAIEHSEHGYRYVWKEAGEPDDESIWFPTQEAATRAACDDWRVNGRGDDWDAWSEALAVAAYPKGGTDD